MERVGAQLKHWAIDGCPDAAKDVFGRSAYNRYYYAAFLTTKDMLATLGKLCGKKGWGKTPHKAIPDCLQGCVSKKFKKQLKVSIKTTLLNQEEGAKSSEQFQSNINALADLMKSSYEVRIVADYEPEIRIVWGDDGRSPSLNGYGLSSARDWHKKARIYCKEISRSWKEVGLG